MQPSITFALVALAALGLAAGAVDGQAPATQPTPAPEQPASPIPNVGFSPSVSDAAITACRNALDAQTEGNVDVVASEYSQANVVVYMTVGSNRAPWKCFTANDGSYANTELMGSEGAL
jgi:hypothetical protein